MQENHLFDILADENLSPFLDVDLAFAFTNSNELNCYLPGQSETCCEDY
jgi:hypothetical protein